VEGSVCHLPVICIGDIKRAGKGLLDLAVKPVLDTHVYKAGRNEKQEYCGDERECDKSDYKLAAQPGTERIPPPLQYDAGNIAENQINKEDDEKQDYIDQAEYEDIGNTRNG